MDEQRKGLYYGWVVVGCGFMAMFMNYGVRNMQTLLLKNYSGDLNLSRAAASLPFAICILIYAVLAPVTGKLVDRYGPRWVMAGGALISGIGLWLCSQANSLLALIFFFGIVFGVGGNGIGLVPTNTSTAMWFRRRLGLALGIMSVGIGIGTMVLPPITTAVLNHWGWRGAFQVLGYMTMALAIPLALLLRGPKAPKRIHKETASVSAKDNQVPIGGLTTKEALRTKEFWLMFVAFVLMVIAIYGIMLHLGSQFDDLGISKSWVSLSVTLIGLTSIIGRLSFGWLSDRTREKKYAMLPACAVLGFSILILMFVQQVWSLMLFAAIFGIGYASYGPIVPGMTAEVFGKENMGGIFGALTTGGALGGAAGPYITGFIHDVSGSYLWAWIMALACVVTSTILFMRVNIVWKESRAEELPPAVAVPALELGEGEGDLLLR